MPETYSPGWYPDPTGAEPYWWWDGGPRHDAVRANPRLTGRRRGGHDRPASRWVLLACVLLLLLAATAVVVTVG